jgi:iron complex outermembrane recepter protein
MKFRTLKYLVFAFLLTFLTGNTMISRAQSVGGLAGTVTDENNAALPGATIVLGENELITTTDSKGNFRFTNIRQKRCMLIVSFVGYGSSVQEVSVRGEKNLKIKLEPESHQLDEVSVKEKMIKTLKQEDSRNIEVVDNRFLDENQSSSLMQTLSRMPGISSMDIGSGQSKPVIRGLSFNRVVVAENGISMKIADK